MTEIFETNSLPIPERRFYTPGCILLLLLILSHGPFALPIQAASVPVTLLRVFTVTFVCLLYGVNSRPGTFINACFALWRKVQPWNQTIDQWTRTAIVTLSHYVALPELTKEIVFAYSVAILFNNHENQYVFAWVISLLGNHCLSMSLGMAISRKTNVSKYLTLAIVSCVCLSFSVRHYSCVYTLTTVLYHCLTHEWIVNSFIIAVKTFDLDAFEGLEKFYVWVLAYLLQFLLGAGHALLLLHQVDCHFLTVTLFAPVVLMCYIVCYPSFVGFVRVCTILHQYRKRLSWFPPAKQAEIESVRLDVCAVCLCRMANARRTPCQHYFHGKCLIRCLRHRTTCPMCKTVFEIPK